MAPRKKAAAAATESQEVSTTTAEEQLEKSRSRKQKAKFPRLRDEYLEQSGIIGWKKNSCYMMSSLLAGHVLCFMGAHGTAKTYGCKRIATKWLGCADTLLTIDASKVDWDEILGPPNLAALREGRQEFVKTPLSIWNKKVFVVDELTRATKKVQNGLLEILRNNTLQHLPTDIEYKWCAANSLSYPGTEALDDALADRVMYVVAPPTLLDLKEAQIKSVFQQAEKVDEQILSKFVPGYQKVAESYPDLRNEIQAYLQGCGAQYRIIRDNLKVAEYVTALTTLYMKDLDAKDVLSNNVYTFSTRRAKMTFDAIIANLAVELYEYESYLQRSTEGLSDEKKKAWLAKNAFTPEEKTDWMRETIYNTVMATINTALTGKKVTQEYLAAAHRTALLNIDSNDLSPIYRIKSERNLIKQFIKSLVLSDANDGEGIVEVHDIFRKMEEIVDDENHAQNKEIYITMLFLMVRNTAYKKLLDKMPQELIDKMKEKTAYSFEFIILDKTEDLTQRIQDYCGQNIYEDMSKEYTDEEWWQPHILAIEDPVQRTQRSVALHTLMSEEREYIEASLALGKIQESTDPKEIAEQEAFIVKEKQRIEDMFINEMIDKVDNVHTLIREALSEEGFSV